MLTSRERYFGLHNSYAGEAPPLWLNGVAYVAREYLHDDSRSHVLFLRNGERPTNSSSRLGLFKEPSGQTCFLGMYVRDELRGNGAAKAIAQYFLDYCTYSNLSISETATIRKPLVALGLEKVGFSPQPGGTKVTILPRCASDESNVPKIMVTPPQEMPLDAIDHSDAGSFYQIVDVETAARVYPSAGPFTEATIHARFLPPVQR